MRGGSGFTSQDFSRAMHHFIPNDMTVEDRYHHKAFCGTYSQDGNFFLTACQGVSFYIMFCPSKFNFSFQY